MERMETLCPHATILDHRWLPGTRSRLLSIKPNEWMYLSPLYTRMDGEWLRYANSTSQYSLAFSLKVRDDWGFQVNPLCRHDITSPFPPSGNGGYVRNINVAGYQTVLVYTDFQKKTTSETFIFCIYFCCFDIGHGTQGMINHSTVPNNKTTE